MKFEKKVVSLYILGRLRLVFFTKSPSFDRKKERKKESNFRRHAFVWSVKLAKFSGARSRVQPRAMTRLARLNEPGSSSPWRVLSTTAKFPRTGFNNTISFGKVARQRGRRRSRMRTMRKLICTDTLEINTACAVTITSKSF